jgi:hypothetical protein
MNPPILISNSFPFSLVRRHLTVEPRSIGDLQTALLKHPWVSTWGHANTVLLASSLAGVNLRPKTERPALTLNESQFPQLDGQSFAECWLLTPDYVEPGFRPKIGEEVSADKIRDWQILRLSWQTELSA